MEEVREETQTVEQPLVNVPETLGIILVSKQLLANNFFLLPEIEILAASNDAMSMHSIALLVRCKDAFPLAEASLMPIYTRATIDGKEVAYLDHCDYEPVDIRTFAGKTLMPLWLIAPDSSGIIRLLKPVLQALVYLMHQKQGDVLELSAAELRKLCDRGTIKSCERLLDLLRERKFLTWTAEGYSHRRRWTITMTPELGMEQVLEEMRKHD